MKLVCKLFVADSHSLQIKCVSYPRFEDVVMRKLHQKNILQHILTLNYLKLLVAVVILSHKNEKETTSITPFIKFQNK